MKSSRFQQQKCPYCQATSGITKLARFMLPERQMFNMRSARLNQCQQCKQIFMSLFEETITGSKHEDVWNLYHYYLPQALQAELLINATLCSAPDRKYCRCGVHAMINEIDFSRLEKMEGE